MDYLFTKSELARAKRVSLRTIDNWVTRGLLDPPQKLGSEQQSRVRWTEAQLAELDKRLAALSGAK